MNLNRPGAWTAVRVFEIAASGRKAPHQIWAKLRKKSCVSVTFNPGRFSSSKAPGVERSQLSYTYHRFTINCNIINPIYRCSGYSLQRELAVIAF